MNCVKIILITFIGTLLLSCDKVDKTKPERKDIREAVFGNGYIEQEREYILSASVNGFIDSLFVSEGDMVDIGAPLVVLESDIASNQLKDAQRVYHNAQENASSNSPLLAQLEAQIIQAKEQLRLDETNYKRYRDLRNMNSVSQLDFDRAELQYNTSRKQLENLEGRYRETKEALLLDVDRSRIQVSTQFSVLDDYRLIANMAGRVISIYKKEGELVRTGDAIAKIGSGAHQIKLFISEDDIRKVEVGQTIAIHLNTYPNEIYPATVSKILPGFNDEEQSYEVEALFDQLPERMFSGTQLQANIEIAVRENALVIPTSFLVSGKYVIMEDKSMREITVGSRNEEWVEVISGIAENDVIIKK